MRKTFTIAALAVALCGSSALAADMAVKALPIPYTSSPCTLTNCSGFYAGIDIQQAGGNFNLISSGGNAGVAINDLAMGFNVGYQFWNGQYFLAAEAGADYGLVQNGPMPGNGNRSLWSADALLKAGVALSPLFGGTVTSNAAVPTPTLPVSLGNALMSPYAIVGLWRRPWGTGLAAGAGVEALLSASTKGSGGAWTVSADYIHVNYNNANINPILTQQTENIVRAGLNYHF